jgi:hypothetical protein
MRLTWHLYSFSNRKRVSLRDIRDGIIMPELLAESALENRIVCDVPSDHDPETPLPVEAEATFLRTVQAAENRFLYLWEVCSAEVKSTKRLAVLTLLLSFLVVSYGAFSTFSETYNSANITGTQALIKTGFRLLDRLAHGLLVCTALYGTAILFEGALMRRRNSWRRICLASKKFRIS